eukprot:scaffold329725_cov35-Attheya_sp.AAC.1
MAGVPPAPAGSAQPVPVMVAGAQAVVLPPMTYHERLRVPQYDSLGGNYTVLYEEQSRVPIGGALAPP